MYNMKILSPVGNLESLKQAIYNGADEIYLGVKEFNARNNIEGFDLGSLKQAVDFAHIYNVRVFLAIIVVVSLVVFVNGVMKYNELLEDQRELENTRDQLIEEKEQLEELMNAEDRESYVVRMARKFWNLFFPEEEIYFNNGNS